MLLTAKKWIAEELHFTGGENSAARWLRGGVLPLSLTLYWQHTELNTFLDKLVHLAGWSS